MRRGFCFVRAKAEKEQELSEKAQTTQNRKDKHKPGCRRVYSFKCLTTHCKALQRAKCGFTHTRSPLHGRTSGSAKSIHADDCTNSAPQTPQNGYATRTTATFAPGFGRLIAPLEIRSHLSSSIIELKLKGEIMFLRNCIPLLASVLRCFC